MDSLEIIYTKKKRFTHRNIASLVILRANGIFNTIYFLTVRIDGFNESVWYVTWTMECGINNKNLLDLENSMREASYILSIGIENLFSKLYGHIILENIEPDYQYIYVNN